MHSYLSFAPLATLPLLAPAVTALGINCRGSGLCPRASWNDASAESVVQVLRDAVWADTADNSTAYGNKDHIICVSQHQPVTVGGGINAGVSSGGEGPTANAGVSGTFSLSGSIGEGGICLFPQKLADGATLDLGTIRPLTDALLEHGCTTCGSVPIHEVDQGSNDPKDGILTFNYVANPFCDKNCLSGSGQAVNNTKVKVRRDEEALMKRAERLEREWSA
ncbi:hypothetical protein ACLMJK_006269 [Lecanora helva]